MPVPTKKQPDSVISRAYARFIKIRGKPREIALGLSLGLFVAMSPFMGFHTAIAVFIAAVLKWNKLSAAIGVWLSNPLTAPIIYGLTWFVGSNITGMTLAENLPETFSIRSSLALILKTPAILWTLTIGGIIVGIPLAIVSYHFTFGVVQRYQEEVRKKIKARKARFKKKRSRRKKKRRKKR